MGNEEMPESYKPEFMERSIRNIAATGKAWGVTWWCSHDIDPAIKGFSDYEYGLGLLDVENKQKPMGRKFAELIREFRRSPPAVVPRPTALVVPELGLSTKAWPPDWRFAAPYMKLVEQGITPAIVTESRAKDDAYLRARRITKLIALESGELDEHRHFFKDGAVEDAAVAGYGIRGAGGLCWGCPRV